jgi:hypothetical protein
MPDREEFDRVLDELAHEIPEELYRDLNGGIVVIDGSKLDPHARANDLYIMGEYIVSREMGRYIAIYYGSFARLYPNRSAEELRGVLRKTLRHEFRHHIESLAGEYALEEDDMRRLDEYLTCTKPSLNDPGHKYRIKKIERY